MLCVDWSTCDSLCHGRCWSRQVEHPTRSSRVAYSLLDRSGDSRRHWTDRSPSRGPRPVPPEKLRAGARRWVQAAGVGGQPRASSADTRRSKAARSLVRTQYEQHARTRRVCSNRWTWQQHTAEERNSPGRRTAEYGVEVPIQSGLPRQPDPAHPRRRVGLPVLPLRGSSDRSSGGSSERIPRRSSQHPHHTRDNWSAAPVERSTPVVCARRNDSKSRPLIGPTSHDPSRIPSVSLRLTVR